MRSWFSARFARDDRGASLVEYLLLVSLIAIAVIAALVLFGRGLSNSFGTAGSIEITIAAANAVDFDPSPMPED